MEYVEELTVKRTGHVRTVGAPREKIKARWVFTLKIVVDPIIPDEVVRPHPREHLGKAARR